MVERQQVGDELSTPRRRRRWLRWLVVLAVTGAVYGLGAVFWRVVMGRSWDDSLSSALTLTLTVVGIQWMAPVIRRRAGRDDG
ncbi:hypothetical protein [Streptomyces prasinus]|uniref:hypothetical protein n=1 Tax=Streptomyces prasinus TaxID=67345 RepID=UPI00369BDB8D